MEETSAQARRERWAGKRGFRGQWDVRVSSESEKKAQRRERRSRREAALATMEPPRIRRKDLARTA